MTAGNLDDYWVCNVVHTYTLHMLSLRTLLVMTLHQYIS